MTQSSNKICRAELSVNTPAPLWPLLVQSNRTVTAGSLIFLPGKAAVYPLLLRLHTRLKIRASKRQIPAIHVIKQENYRQIPA
jgi:hypothetical protein